MSEGARIPLRRRDGSIRAYAIVDAADAEWVNQWRWSLSTSGYAHRKEMQKGQQHTVWLHREVLGLPHQKDGPEGDHIDGDKLNCQRSNLRVIPHYGNTQNVPSYRGSTSRYRGVHLHARSGRWVASVRVNRRATHLGYFTDEQEAANVARAARARLLPYSVEREAVAS